MKLIFYFFIFFFFFNFSQSFYAQENEEIKLDTIDSKFIAEIYYAEGSYFEFVMGVYDGTEMKNVDYTSIGVGGRFEIVRNPTISYSFDLNYVSDQIIHNRASGRVTRREVFRFLPRINFNLMNQENVVIYGSLGIGARYVNWEYRRRPLIDLPIYGYIPFVTARGAIGMRLFLLDNLGLSFEYGVGGGRILNTGLVFKL